ncbi:putative RNA recognition motif domain, nucleotide-binding alpha-beta plait domain superfamily [Helianthus anomalus]
MARPFLPPPPLIFQTLQTPPTHLFETKPQFFSILLSQTPNFTYTFKPQTTHTPVLCCGVTVDPTSEASRRLYVGNIPRTTTNDDLQKVFEEHGAVEKVELDQLIQVKLYFIFYSQVNFVGNNNASFP